jgi:TldD protein
MPSLADLDDRLAHLLRRIEPHTRYAELMAQTSQGQAFRLDRTTTSVQPSAEIQGVVFRAWGPRGWSETATTGFEEDRLLAAAEALIDSLHYAAGAEDPPGPSAVTVGTESTKARRPWMDVPTGEWVELAKSWFSWATGVPGTFDGWAALEGHREERLFRSTAGARTLQTIDRVRATVLALAKENGRVEYDFLVRGGTGGFELVEGLPQASVEHTAREAVALLKAPAAPVGPSRVLLDPSTAGTFAHESFGHGTEADQMVRDRSYLRPYFDQVVGPECLTLVDDGSYPAGWGSIFFDDEGHRSQRTVLVDKGRFVQALHDRESAAALGRRPTGNTRRADCLSRPFVRMTNTFVEPGTMSFEELLREMRSGVILESTTSGVEDPLGGNMQIKVKKGHRVENGEVGSILPSMALSGRVLDFLKSIQGVGTREGFTITPGYCGKGHTDLLPTGTGGAYLLAEATVGPA